MDLVNRCVLTFDTDMDTRRTMSISDPVSDLSRSTVISAADNIIAADLHDGSIGRFMRLYRADMVSTRTMVLL